MPEATCSICGKELDDYIYYICDLDIDDPTNDSASCYKCLADFYEKINKVVEKYSE